uniref:Uncharacterized protein n=1 Tax=Rhizophora mucronata TaxID=61149 RepID=A0A2P2QUY5_RHIMU
MSLSAWCTLVSYVTW